MNLLRLLAITLTLLGLTAAAPQRPRYAEGQVWEYKTRPGEAGSLLRIQKIEKSERPGFLGPIYHISIIGVHFAGLPNSNELQHTPVSGRSLDLSVTRLSRSKAVFPDAAPGIAQWREARGGVFTLSIAEVLSAVEQAYGDRSGS